MSDRPLGVPGEDSGTQFHLKSTLTMLILKAIVWCVRRVKERICTYFGEIMPCFPFVPIQPVFLFQFFIHRS